MFAGLSEIGDAAFEHLPDPRRRLLGRVKTEGAHGDVQQTGVAQQIVDRFHVGDVGNVVGDLVLDEIEPLLQCCQSELRGEVRRRIVLRAIVNRRQFAACGEIVGGHEFGIALVRELVGETFRIGDAFLQGLHHEGLGIGHVLEAVRLHGVAEQAVVLHELLDRFHLGDVLEVVFGLAIHHGLVLDSVERLRKVLRDELVAYVGAEQGQASGRSLFRKARPVCLREA